MSRDLVPAFVKLLKDTEAEVRTAIAGQIPGMSLNLETLTYSSVLTLSRLLWVIRSRDFTQRNYD